MNSSFKPVITKAASKLRDKDNNFRLFIFENSKCSTLPNKVSTEVHERQNFNDKKCMTHEFKHLQEQEFDIRTARKDIVKFAMNNQRTEKQKKKMMLYEIARMGFKRPKKQYKNYKILLKERKRIKEIREQRKKYHQLGKTQSGLASAKCKSKPNLNKRRRKRPPVTLITEQYGSVKK